MKTEHIFIIDDDKFFAKYFIMKFRLLVNSNIEFHHFTGLRPVFAEYTSKAPILIFLDNELNGESGVESIPELREHFPNSEIIVISSVEDNNLAAYSLKKGASQFISKDDIIMDKIAGILNRGLNNSRQDKFFKSLFKV